MGGFRLGNGKSDSRFSSVLYEISNSLHDLINWSAGLRDVIHVAIS